MDQVTLGATTLGMEIKEETKYNYKLRHLQPQNTLNNYYVQVLWFMWVSKTV